MNRFLYSEMKEYLQGLEPFNEHETKHTHHCKEGRGNDRLYITKSDDGSYLFYCHHCGKSGRYREAFSRTREAARRNNQSSRSLGHTAGVQFPSDSEIDWGEWPVGARHWLQKYGITESEQRNYGIAYSRYYHRVVIPVYRSGDLLGWVGRKLDDRSLYPERKYHTVSSDRAGMMWVSPPNVSKTLVLTEDILSAIKVGRHTNSVALLGTALNSKKLNQLTSLGCDRYLVWLDNDNAQVKKNQIKIANALSLFGEVRIIKTDMDPKELSNSEILECIK